MFMILETASEKVCAIQQTFWSDRFGEVVDQFGISLTITGEQAPWPMLERRGEAVRLPGLHNLPKLWSSR